VLTLTFACNKTPQQECVRLLW